MEAYVKSDRAHHAEFATFNPALFTLPALLISSIGDLARLNILTKFMPERQSSDAMAPSAPESIKDPKEAENRGKLEVTETASGLRHRAATPEITVWTYNGRLHCHFTAAREYITNEAFARFVSAFGDWVDFAVGEAQ